VRAFSGFLVLGIAAGRRGSARTKPRPCRTSSRSCARRVDRSDHRRREPRSRRPATRRPKPTRRSLRV
jgi:hypothetical protein